MHCDRPLIQCGTLSDWSLHTKGFGEALMFRQMAPIGLSRPAGRPMVAVVTSTPPWGGAALLVSVKSTFARTIAYVAI